MNSEKIQAAESRGINVRVLDVAIILAVIAVLISVFLRFTDTGLNSSDVTGCEIVYTVSSVKAELQDAIAEGDLLTDTDGDEFGSLSTVNITPAVFYAANNAGEIVEVTYPEDTLIDLNGTIKANLYKTDGGYVTADGTHIAAGTVLKLRTRTADISVTVKSVSAVK